MSVCMGCEDRYPGCHSHCPKRAEEVKRNEEYKKIVRANKNADYDIAGYTAGRVMRAKHRIGKLSNR